MNRREGAQAEWNKNRSSSFDFGCCVLTSPPLPTPPAITRNDPWKERPSTVVKYLSGKPRSIGLGFPRGKQRCALRTDGLVMGVRVAPCSMFVGYFPTKCPRAGVETTSHLEKGTVWCRGEVDFRTHHDEVRRSHVAAGGCCWQRQLGQSTSKVAGARRKKLSRRMLARCNRNIVRCIIEKSSTPTHHRTDDCVLPPAGVDI